VKVEKPYPVAPRPPDASHEGLRKCLKWLDNCSDLGWPEKSLPDLEGMFWHYRDKDGNMKSEK